MGAERSSQRQVVEDLEVFGSLTVRDGAAVSGLGSTIEPEWKDYSRSSNQTGLTVGTAVVWDRLDAESDDEQTSIDVNLSTGVITLQPGQYEIFYSICAAPASNLDADFSLYNRNAAAAVPGSRVCQRGNATGPASGSSKMRRLVITEETDFDIRFTSGAAGATVVGAEGSSLSIRRLV